MKTQCIGYECKYYFNSDDYELCQLINQPIISNKCYGLLEIPDRKEEMVCRIEKLTKEFDNLCLLETLIRENQN